MQLVSRLLMLLQLISRPLLLFFASGSCLQCSKEAGEQLQSYTSSFMQQAATRAVRCVCAAPGNALACSWNAVAGVLQDQAGYLLTLLFREAAGSPGVGSITS